MSVLAFILRLFLGAVFIVAGGLKIADPSQFLLDILAFEAVPYPVAYLSAYLVPWVEVLAGLVLMFHARAAGASLLLLALTLSFIVLLDMARRHGLGVDCGCFGEYLVFPSIEAHILFNAGMAVGFGLLLIRQLRMPSPSRS